jgi:hypothetical protein
MKTLNLHEAAAFLRMNAESLRHRVTVFCIPSGCGLKEEVNDD